MRKLTSGSFFMMRVAMVYIPTVSVDVESNFTLNSTCFIYSVSYLIYLVEGTYIYHSK